ncbi:recombinase family protein [Budviciaceae bacterium BWR-B9]|uniref:Recombinase family protein n=1 Tax=Limnobaculum allomyrinae TaxID=2791986 RepID=A0ABS1IVH4_9GAMM|nr:MULTISPECIES: recombinase family protein [Limnobaculum]MBK5145255.1 recombinase family protein [Limnobaculum allomyrinae]MBV7693087.1 recombinase family protein [Limnobaculum sp. M2-1]
MFRCYLRASTTEQDAERAKTILEEFISDSPAEWYIENHTGTMLNRPILNQLLEDALPNDILLVESVDRLSRLSLDDWETLKSKINDKKLRLVVLDMPTTHQQIAKKGIESEIMYVINNMLIDLMATMARLDQQKRVERIRQGQERAKAQGKRIGGRGINEELHERVTKRLAANNISVEDIAKLEGCGVATVYRIKKQLKNQ